ncbi:MAG: SDR family NAD(P)-dependent oxidoreductase [Oscillibacter sp.]|nr:SDR family NAD(P)-dependent oxidoreductase [Oscillibacter sp.]
MKEFKGKVALITGAAHGIGRSFAIEAAKRGMKLSLVDIDAENLVEAKAECEELGADVLAIFTDVSVYAEVHASVEKTMQRFGQIDVLFSNAGIATAGSILNIPVRDWEWAVAVNTLGLAYYTHDVLPIMERQGTPAHFLCTASVAGLRAGMAVNPPYFCSKHGAVSIAESVKAQVEADGSDIGVSVFCPMYVATDIANSERHRPARFTDPDDPYYSSEEYTTARTTFTKNVAGGMDVKKIGPRLFRAIEENQMYIVSHTATIPYIEERHRAIEADAKYELTIDQ